MTKVIVESPLNFSKLKAAKVLSKSPVKIDSPAPAPSVQATRVDQPALSNNDLDEMLKGLKQKTEEKKMESNPLTNILKKEREKPSPSLVDRIFTASLNQLRLQIHSYGKNKKFGDFLQKECGINLSFPTLLKKDKKELEELLFSIKALIANRNNDNFINQIVHYGLRGYEYGTQKIGLRTAGLTKALLNNENFTDIVEEVALENYNIIHLRPTYRLCGEVLRATLVLDTSRRKIEKAMRKMNPVETEKMPVEKPEIKNKKTKDKKQKKVVKKKVTVFDKKLDPEPSF